MIVESPIFYCARYFDGRYLSISGGISSFDKARRFPSLRDLRLVVGHDVDSGHCTVEQFFYSEVSNEH